MDGLDDRPLCVRSRVMCRAGRGTLRSGGRCNNGRVKRKNGLKIENLGSLEQERVYNGEILKKCSIIDDYLKNIQYLCSVNAVIIIR